MINHCQQLLLRFSQYCLYYSVETAARGAKKVSARLGQAERARTARAADQWRRETAASAQAIAKHPRRTWKFDPDATQMRRAPPAYATLTRVNLLKFKSDSGWKAELLRVASKYGEPKNQDRGFAAVVALQDWFLTGLAVRMDFGPDVFD